MGETFRFDYYYGIEAEQFSFYRVPRILIKDKKFKNLSSDAKLLYGLMLDRMSLSMKNGWLDAENKVYIYYTMENIMDDLSCAKATAVKVLAELDSKKGIGLVEKKRQGLGRPDIIYVKNFATVEPTEPPKKEETDKSEKDVSNNSGDVKNSKSDRIAQKASDYRKGGNSDVDVIRVTNYRNTDNSDVDLLIANSYRNMDKVHRDMSEASSYEKADIMSASISNEVESADFGFENNHTENLEIELTTGQGADKVMTAVLAGQSDIGFAGPEAAIYVYNEGKEDYMEVFAQMTKRDGSFLVSREQNEDFKWTDLKGSTIIPGRKGRSTLYDI